MQPGNYDAITFDVYGTLIDWEPTILDTLEAWAARNGITATRPALLDAFDRARAHYQTLQPCRDYPRVLRSAFAYIADEYGVAPGAEEQNAFGASVGDWPPYKDSIDALSRLKARYVLGAFTNIDDASFAKSHARLGGCFSVIVTAERAQAYKPALRHFVLGLTDLAAREIPLHRVLHVAQSLRADVRPANLLGQDVVWINRTGRGLGHTGFGAELAEPMATFASMKAFVDAFLG
ncbi:MAG: HAD-IA family hydrolase [Rhodospirillales bacterium]|nr:HAD-IA family hydrolase [Rhodospirillales bacterium]MBO6786928.1 HAD-IA family hydrolase [Rhodospirillales bacterium]